MLGDESLATFSAWHNVKEIIELVPLLIGKRLSTKLDIESFKFSESVLKAVQEGVIEIPLMEISATSIRHRIRKNLPCDHLVPKEVLTIIKKNRLYF